MHEISLALCSQDNFEKALAFAGLAKVRSVAGDRQISPRIHPLATSHALIGGNGESRGHFPKLRAAPIMHSMYMHSMSLMCLNARLEVNLLPGFGSFGSLLDPHQAFAERIDAAGDFLRRLLHAA